MSSGDKSTKGSFSIDFGEEAIEEALRAVERLEADAEPVEVEESLEILEIEPSIAEVEDEDLPAGEEALLHEARERLHALEEENRLLRDRTSSLTQDMENLRKRTAREKEEAERFSVEKLLLELIPVLDNFDRAQEHARRSGDLASLSEGIEMVHRLFEETLQKFGVRSFRAVGERFDPELHEAVQLRETDEHPPNVVVEEMVRGYLLHERLVRPAMVCVSTSKGGSADDGS